MQLFIKFTLVKHWFCLFFIGSKVSGLSGEVSGYIFWGITEKETFYCEDNKHFIGSVPQIHE